jgi:hypothetical protein
VCPQRDEPARERHAEDKVADRQVPGFLQHFLFDLESVAEQDQDQSDDG